MWGDFLIKPGHFEYYFMRRWVLSRYFVSVFFLWRHSSKWRGDASSLLPDGTTDGNTVSLLHWHPGAYTHMAYTDTIRRRPYCWVVMKVLNLRKTSCTTPARGGMMPPYHHGRWKSKLPMWSPLIPWKTGLVHHLVEGKCPGPYWAFSNTTLVECWSTSL